MQDIYGKEYLLISKKDYNKMLDRIKELEIYILDHADKPEESFGENLKAIFNENESNKS